MLLMHCQPGEILIKSSLKMFQFLNVDVKRAIRKGNGNDLENETLD